MSRYRICPSGESQWHIEILYGHNGLKQIWSLCGYTSLGDRLCIYEPGNEASFNTEEECEAVIDRELKAEKEEVLQKERVALRLRTIRPREYP